MSKIFVKIFSFQKTESAVKTAAEKTSSLFGGITSGFSSKISQMKNSESFKSFEERLGSTYENVKVSSTKHKTNLSNLIEPFFRQRLAHLVPDQSLASTIFTNTALSHNHLFRKPMKNHKNSICTTETTAACMAINTYENMVKK